MKHNNHHSTLQDESFNVSTGKGKENDPLTDEIILANKVPTDPVGCPKCKGNTYSLEGYNRIPFTNQVDGNVPTENLDDDGIKVIEIMVCPACQIRWHIADELSSHLYTANLELSRENHELRFMLAFMMHTPPTTMGEEN
jgi:hypothetical protein